MEKLLTVVDNVRVARSTSWGGELGERPGERLSECLGYNALPSVIPPRDRIIAIGDLHGDLKLCIESLVVAGVIKTGDILGNGEVIYDRIVWTGGDTVVVQVGDQVDRCRPPPEHRCSSPRAMGNNDEASDITVMEVFTRLDRLARESGGMVLSLLGNHELMNVAGDMSYVSYLGLRQFDNYVDADKPDIKFNSGEDARVHAFKPGNQYGKFLGCTRLASVIIGSNLFVHAGILPKFSKRVGIRSQADIERINDMVRGWLVGKLTKDNIDGIVGSFRDSMFWTRIMGAIRPNSTSYECKTHLEPVLQTLNVGRMIIGHTPQFFTNDRGINSACDGRLWRVDVGGSDAFEVFSNRDTYKHRGAQVLEILNDDSFRVLK